MCHENRISHWKDTIDSKDAIVLHKPLEAEEDQLPLYVGKFFLWDIVIYHESHQR